jgi:hypothetical protein
MSGHGSGQQSDGDECTIDIPAKSYDLDGGTMAIQPGPQPHYGIQLGFPINQFPEATISCPDEAPQTGPFPGPMWMIYTADPQQASVRGTYQGSTTFSGASFTWNLNDPLAPPP